MSYDNLIDNNYENKPLEPNYFLKKILTSKLKLFTEYVCRKF